MFFPMDRESLPEATSGAIGALVSTIVLYPLDTCKTKLQAELQTHQGMHKYRVTMSLSRDEQKLNDSLKGTSIHMPLRLESHMFEY